MPYHFTFIGIDRYADPGIRDLSGASNDARALWALFTDTFPDAQSHFLADADATTETVRTQITSVLSDATTEDVAIVFFAGHGTRDHRLVTHDTKRADLSRTTIAMDEIATLFRNTRARVAILILDCCFSGGLTARVLAESPASRDFSNPLIEIVGQGRVIITASRFDEPAYELPGHDHGLLTKALLDAFETSEYDTVLGMAENVLKLVRNEALKLGVEQTPVFLGEIQGSLILPKMSRGANYLRLFPDASNVQISSSIVELVKFGLPEPIIHEWQKRFPSGLNEVQLQAVNQFRVLNGKSLLVIAPTSAGKTFVGEMAAAKAVVEGRKAVFLLPYRALVNEKYDQFQAVYGHALGMRVVRCTGDYSDQVNSLVRGKFDLALLTYEMFLNTALAVPTILQQLGLVVLDEAQFVTDPHRGITVELLLTLLIAARRRGINPQLVALSAVIGGTNQFNDWLGVDILRTDRRPVPLTESVIDRTGTLHKGNTSNGDITREDFLPSFQIQQRGEKPSSQDVLVPLVRKLTSLGQKVLIFRNVRGKAEGCANYLAQDLDLAKVEDALAALPKYDESSSLVALRRCLEHGTAFHNSNLRREEKEIVERAFRDPNSPLRVLVATTTVAAGINTPASTVIIAEQHFVGEDGREFTVAEYKNMAGRAGRLGFNEEGMAIILSGRWSDTERLLRRYVLGTPESLVSSFQEDEIDTWLVRLLAQVKDVALVDVSSLLTATYGGYIASTRDVTWKDSTTRRISDLLDQMMRLGLLEQQNGRISLTPLGRACGKSTLGFRSALRVIEVVRALDPSDLGPMQMLALVQSLDEADATYTPMFKKGQKEAVRAQEAAQRFGNTIIIQLQKFAGDMFAYWARCKRAALVFDWINGESVEAIEKRYSVTPYQGRVSFGDISRITDMTRFCLRSVYEIVALVFPANCAGGDEVELLCKSLEVGLPADSIELLDLPTRLSRGEYLALRTLGLVTLGDVLAADRNQVEAVIGKASTDRIFG